MSKEEFLKIQTCTLKVGIHCDGCKQKVQKILQKLEGVYKVGVDSEQGKVTVSGIVDPSMLIETLKKQGKQAQVWDVPKENQPMNKQRLEGDGGDNEKQGKKEGGEKNKQLKDLKLQFKDVKLPFIDKKCGQKSVHKIGESDDDDEKEDNDESDDDMDDIPTKKPMIGGGGMNQKLMKGGQNVNEVGNDGKKVEGDQNHVGSKNNNADGGDQSENQNVAGSIHVNGVHRMPNMSGMVNGLPVGVQMNVYVQGAGPHNPNYQQQLINQQRPNGNEMYAQPPADVINMQPQDPYPYPEGNNLAHFFSDYNTSSCNIM